LLKLKTGKRRLLKIAKHRRAEMIKIAKTVNDDVLTDTYKQKYSVVECDPSFMKGNEKYFGLKYSFGDWDDWKVQVGKSSLENAVAGDYEVI
jgi:hypothetical protein